MPEGHREILVSQGCIVREIEPEYPTENQTQFAMAYYSIMSSITPSYVFGRYVCYHSLHVLHLVCLCDEKFFFFFEIVFVGFLHVLSQKMHVRLFW